jgi:hypothetical protein
MLMSSLMLYKNTHIISIKLYKGPQNLQQMRYVREAVRQRLNSPKRQKLPRSRGSPSRSRSSRTNSGWRFSSGAANGWSH